ncbi:MAG TPA: hypothetical protein VF066_13045 [Thermoleophilaceae bacterium]
MPGSRAVASLVCLIAVFATASTAFAHHDDKDTTIYLPDSTTYLLSKSLAGTIPNGPSRSPAISQDQRIAKVVAFESDATDLVPNDANNLTDVFFIRRAEPYGNDGTPWQGSQTEIGSTGMGGQPANGRSYLPALDGDSKNLSPHCLAFISEASNLVPGDSNGVADAFVRNLDTGAISRVSVNSQGQQANGPSFDVSLSGDCARVAFTATATNLALTNTKEPNLKPLVTSAAPTGIKQVYVRVLPGDPKDGTLVGQTFLASASNKQPANGDSFDPDWSRPGKAVVFTSAATNLDTRDGAPNQDVYMRQSKRIFGKYKVTECKFKRKRGKRVKVCHRTLRGRQTLDLQTRWASQGSDGDSFNASVTDDATKVVYTTSATNLDTRDVNGRFDIYRANLKTDPPEQLLISTTKTAVGNGESLNPKITAAGVAIFFDSTASNLKMFPNFLEDTNLVQDMMVGIPIHGSSSVDSLTWENHFADGNSHNPAPSARHNYVLFESTASNLDQSVRNPDRMQSIYLRYDGPFSGDAVVEP